MKYYVALRKTSPDNLILFSCLQASYLVISMIVITAKGQATAGNEHLKYNFAFSVEDKGLHTREERSESEGHVSGKYSYVDPYGYLRVIQYNSTPETGFRAYGDTGAIPDSSFKTLKLSSSNLPQKIERPYAEEKIPSDPIQFKDAPIRKVSNHFSGNSNFLFMMPSYFEALRPLDQVGILSQPSSIRNESLKESGIKRDASENSLNAIYFNEANRRIQSKTEVDNTVNQINAIETSNNTLTNKAKVDTKVQEFLGGANKHSYYNPLWTTTVSMFPFFAHPVPFLFALSPNQVVL